MTREERIEEMLHHAHERGYYNQVFEKAQEIGKSKPNLNYYERWELAYNITKSEFYETRNTGKQPR